MARYGYARYIRERLRYGWNEQQIIAGVRSQWTSFTEKKARHYVRYYANERARRELDARVSEVNAAATRRETEELEIRQRRQRQEQERATALVNQLRANQPRANRMERVTNYRELERQDHARAAVTGASLTAAVATIQAPAPARQVTAQLTGTVNDERPDRFQLIEMD